jgi:hypothetical protein
MRPSRLVPTMQQQPWALLLLVATTLAPACGLAQPLPRACLDWHKDPKGPLPRMDSENVIYRPILFKRAGQDYDVETFSDMSPVKDEHCFRWEIVNSSKSPDLVMDELAWPVAGIRVTRMRPGDKSRDYNNRREQIPPDRQNNLVYAFENEKAPTQSWMASVQAAASKSNAGSGAGYSMRTGELLPGLRTGEPSILNRIIAVITLGQDRRAAPEISQVVGYDNLGIRVTSRAVLEGNTLLISTDAQINEPPSNEARFNFSGLSALQRTEPKSVGDLKEAERFLEVFRETVRSSEAFRPEWNFRFPVTVRAGENVTVYRVLQPVTVSVGAERHCYLTSGYSPIPIGLSLQNCW